MDKILSGVARFNEAGANDVRPLLSQLAQKGQSPQALFITCADSRLVPDLITGTDPGDLFIMRNIGNIVPRYDHMIGADPEISVASLLEYALDMLKLRNIIVCGHSDCGAMKAVTNRTALPEDSHLQTWLAHAEASVTRRDRSRPMNPTLPPHDQIAQFNVLQQVENLRSYPVVEKALNEGRLNLYNWFFDIGNAEVQIYDPLVSRFVRLRGDSDSEWLATQTRGHTARDSDDAKTQIGSKP